MAYYPSNFHGNLTNETTNENLNFDARTLLLEGREKRPGDEVEQKFSRFFCAHLRFLQSVSTAKDLKKSLIGDGRIWSASCKKGINSVRHFRIEKRTGAEICRAIVSGIVSKDGPDSYTPLSHFPNLRSGVFVKSGRGEGNWNNNPVTRDINWDNRERTWSQANISHNAP